MKENEYVSILQKIISFLKQKNKIIYVPHPRENPINLKKYFKNIKILNIDYPIELYLLGKNKYPKKVIALGSTALIILKKLSNKFRLLNIVQKKTLFTNVHKNRNRKFNFYIKKKGIKTKII